MGRSRAASHQGCPLGDPDIGLPEHHPVLPGLAAEQDDRLVHQPSVGREGHGLGLHRGVHRHPLQVLRHQGTGLVRHRQALLDQRQELLFAQPLAPAGQRGAFERQLMLETLLAAEVLIVRVLQPARAQDLVGQIVHMCLRMNSPATSRVAKGGCPGPALHTEPKRPSRKSQSISRARRASG